MDKNEPLRLQKFISQCGIASRRKAEELILQGKVKINGKREILEVKLSPEVVDPDDIEMLQDLIVAAANEAIRKVDEETASAMSRLTGGLGSLGGLGGGLPF